MKRADVCCLEQDDLLFQEGSNADFMGIVLEGTLEVVVASPQADRRLGIVGPGDPVGEMALLLGGTRSATVRALEPVVLARFDRTQVGAIVESSPALRAALEAVIHQRLERNRITQAVQGLFGALEPDVLRYVVDQLDPVVVERNEYLFRKGDPGDALYLVVSGSLEVLAEDSDGTERVIAHVR
ncbi:MAG: cyclic nucleotide-binding domain-containing protein, partial [Spirochaetaceae bacterium]